MKYILTALLFIFSIISAYSGQTDSAEYLIIPSPENESMSGELTRLDTNSWEIGLKDDNNNKRLFNWYRTWYYVRIDSLSTTDTTTIAIKGDGWSTESSVLPVYSYDNKNWLRFDTSALSPSVLFKYPDNNRYFYKYILKKKFAQSTIWIARFYPYTYEHLQQFLNSYKSKQYLNRWLRIDTIGYGEYLKKYPIQMLTITDRNFPDSLKKRVWIHARTHPSETGSSFVTEGIIRYLLSAKGQYSLSRIIYHIVPMLGVDGVVLGNSRVTPGNNYDLERKWYRDPENQYRLLDSSAGEVKAIYGKIVEFDSLGPKFIAALNIHTCNQPESKKPFIFSNFRSSFFQHTRKGCMWFKQARFVDYLKKSYCYYEGISAIPASTELPFEKKIVPETWWWANFKDSVMAATFEITTGKIGCDNNWVNEKDLLRLGEATAIALEHLNINWDMLDEQYSSSVKYYESTFDTESRELLEGAYSEYEKLMQLWEEEGFDEEQK